MHNLQHFNDMVEHELERVTNLRESLGQVFVDKDLSLEDRWALFIKSKDLLAVDHYYSDSLNILTDSPYDDLNCERYQTQYHEDIDTSLVENYDPDYDPNTDDDWGRAYMKRHSAMYAKRDEWREAVLAEGKAGFVYDW